MLTLGILGSGSGSNMQAIVDAISRGDLRARIAIVLSDQPTATILKRAENLGIPSATIDCGGHKTKFPLQSQMETADKLKNAKVDLVCLAGFMRLVKKPLLDAFPSRIINIHPSLLPKFPGVSAWKQAIQANAKETGATVHVVDSGMDTGPIILQDSLEIDPSESSEGLHERIKKLEHRLYPLAIQEHAEALKL
ncbi:MAG: phosphoribosylglycinamide formyltransferase [Akkermansiaceae bacterium]